MKLRKFVFLIGILPWLTSSCVTNRMVSVLEINDNLFDRQIANEPPDFIVLPGYELRIEIRSSEVSSINITKTFGEEKKYIVDDIGNIDLPLVGNIHVAGKRVSEIATIIEESISQYFNAPFVRLSLARLEFTSLGEFQEAGNYDVNGSGLTLFKAVAVSGDFTQVANLEEIIVIRSDSSGRRAHKVNLKDPSFLTSEFYYLYPGDQLIANPRKIANFIRNQQNVRFLSGVVLVLATALILF